MARRIVQRGGIGSDVNVQTQRISRTSRICAGPTRQPRSVITRAVIVEPALFVSLLTRVAVALVRLRLTADSLKRRAAEWVVLFVRNNSCLLVQFQTYGSEMVSELIPDQ